MTFRVARLRKWRADLDKDKSTGKKYGGKETVRYGIYGTVERRFREGKKVVGKHLGMAPELTLGVIKGTKEQAKKLQAKQRRKAKKMKGEMIKKGVRKRTI